MKISSKLFILALAFSTVGCQGVKRLLDGPSGQMPDQGENINPNDRYYTGTTEKDHQSVYMPVKGRTITVEVLRPGETVWLTLERPDPFDYYDSYQLFQIPQEGVYFGKWAYHNTTGGVTFTSDPSAPKGTQYRIHNFLTPSTK